jgi:hypothetical protein
VFACGFRAFFVLVERDSIAKHAPKAGPLLINAETPQQLKSAFVERRNGETRVLGRHVGWRVRMRPASGAASGLDRFAHDLETVYFNAILSIAHSRLALLAGCRVRFAVG